MNMFVNGDFNCYIELKTLINEKQRVNIINVTMRTAIFSTFKHLSNVYLYLQKVQLLSCTQRRYFVSNGLYYCENCMCSFIYIVIYECHQYNNTLNVC